MFQFISRIYTPAAFILTFVMPITLSYYLGEDAFRALNANILRYTISLHVVWLVNSGAHYFGMKPYEKYALISSLKIKNNMTNSIFYRDFSATESYFVAWAALGEGWHNYHHVFPCNYNIFYLVYLP